MPGLPGEIARLFSVPGLSPAGEGSLLPRAAAAHDFLLHAALANAADGPQPSPWLAVIAALLPRDPLTRSRFLCDPVLVEGLHELASISAAVHDWHDCTAADDARTWTSGADPPSAASLLGNSALALLLRTDQTWCGALPLRTDAFGLVRFPLCDWTLSLAADDPAVGLAAEQPVSLRITSRDAVWMLGHDNARPFLRMPRSLLTQLVSRNDPCAAATGMQALDPLLHPRWERAVPLCPQGVRFLPVHSPAGLSRTEICGGLAQWAHDELLRTSPAVHAEFCTCIEWITGFTLPGRADGIVQSFSEPTRPRLMGFNVPFNDAGEPRLCPFCTTWLGHELGHTKMYLMGSIGWRDGWQFLRNAGATTGIIRRYGRSLSLRTLFQIPYTHLYEWIILMDARDDLPAAEFVSFGEDLRSEITEAFDAIERLADLTPHGRGAVDHFHRLFDDADTRWQHDRCIEPSRLAAHIERLATESLTVPPVADYAADWLSGISRS